MTSPATPPPPGSSEPPIPPGDDEPSGVKPWIPAIALGVVLLVLIAFLFLRSDGGDDDTAASTTTTSSTTTSSTTTSTTPTTTPTTAPPPTTAPTTAPPPTVAPTTAPPTTAPTTTTQTDPESAALISQCNAGDEFACYEVGRLKLTPPASIKNPGSWSSRSDDDVASACQQDLDLTACYVAGSRGLELGD